jgi:hypothetical protein
LLHLVPPITEAFAKALEFDVGRPMTDAKLKNKCTSFDQSQIGIRPVQMTGPAPMVIAPTSGQAFANTFVRAVYLSVGVLNLSFFSLSFACLYSPKHLSSGLPWL